MEETMFDVVFNIDVDAILLIALIVKAMLK